MKRKLQKAFNNPRNLRDGLFGLFVNSLYGVTQSFSIFNLLLLVVALYGIIEANDKMEGEQKC